MKKILYLFLILIIILCCKKKNGNNLKNNIEIEKLNNKKSSLSSEEIINKYYSLLNEHKLEEAYEISPKKISYEKFTSWYNNIESIEIKNLEKEPDGYFTFNVILKEDNEKFYFEVHMKTSDSKIIESSSKKLNNIDSVKSRIVDGYKMVTAFEGLRILEEPSLEGKKLDIIPYGDIVCCHKTYGKEFSIEGVYGKWTSITWCGREGWVFGGFLTNEITIKKYKRNEILGTWLPNHNYGGFSIWMKDNGSAMYLFMDTEWTGITSMEFVYSENDQIVTFYFKFIRYNYEFDDEYPSIEDAIEEDGTSTIEIIYISKNTMLIKFCDSDIYLVVKDNPKYNDYYKL